jgi:hypothetical protein
MHHSTHGKSSNLMKITQFVFVVAAVSLTACSTTNRERQGSSKADPETVMVTYHVKPGKEAEFQQVLARAWKIYRSGNLVLAKPHVIVRETEQTDKTRLVEIFTWVSHAAPEHAPEAVKTIWGQEQSLCEPRNAHGGIEGGEVEIVNGR